MSVAVLMPTFNRNDFVIRWLEYYAAIECPYHFYIGDSTLPDDAKSTIEKIESLKDKIKISYFHLPNMSDHEVSQILSGKITEKYLVWCPDDDYFMPSGIDKCVNFLEANPDYVSAYGKGLLFQLEEGPIHGHLKAIDKYGSYRDLVDESAANRLIDLTRSYAVLEFAVHRTEDYHKCHSEVEKIPLRLFRELSISFKSALLGKFKHLDVLTIVRQVHPLREDYPTILDQVLDDRFHPSYSNIRKKCVEIIMEKDGVSEEEGIRQFNQAFKLYMGNCVNEPSDVNSSRRKISWALNKFPYVKNQMKRIYYSVFEDDMPFTLDDKFLPHFDESNFELSNLEKNLAGN